MKRFILMLASVPVALARLRAPAKQAHVGAAARRLAMSLLGFLLLAVLLTGCQKQAGSAVPGDSAGGGHREGDRGDPKPSVGVGSVSFSPDSKYLLLGYSISPDSAAHLYYCMKLWDMTTGKEVKGYPLDGSSWAHATFLPDGKTAFFATGKGNVGVFDVTTGKELWSKNEYGNDPQQFRHHYVVTPDGKTATTILCDPLLDADVQPFYNVTINKWELQTGKLALTNAVKFKRDYVVYPKQLSADGEYALIWESDNLIRRILETRTGKLRPSLAQGKPVAFSKDGRFALLVRGDANASFTAYELSTGKTSEAQDISWLGAPLSEKQFAAAKSQKIAILRSIDSPDGMLSFRVNHPGKGATKEFIEIWDLKKNKLRWTLESLRQRS